MSACIIHDKKDIDKAKKELASYTGVNGAELASKVSIKKKYDFKENVFQHVKKSPSKDKKLKVIAYDFGVKKKYITHLKFYEL